MDNTPSSYPTKEVYGRRVVGLVSGVRQSHSQEVLAVTGAGPHVDCSPHHSDSASPKLPRSQQKEKLPCKSR
jgi:hypothetical protein